MLQRARERKRQRERDRERVEGDMSRGVEGRETWRLIFVYIPAMLCTFLFSYSLLLQTLTQQKAEKSFI